MASEKYIVIPGTQQKVYDGTVVMLHRLPNLRWIIHNGYYSYNGRKQKGWYFSEIPSDTTMPVFNEDLVAMTIIDPQPGPCPPGPFPPGPHPPKPPQPVPISLPFMPEDKMQVDEAMLTVDDLAERDKLSSCHLQDGKIVRVNDIDGQGKIEYFSWNAKEKKWEEASLGYRFMTREEIEEAIADDIVSIAWSNDEGSLVLSRQSKDPESVELTGVAHDPVFLEEDLELKIPRYGLPDLVVKIPHDKYLRKLDIVLDYEFPDGHKGPAVVVVVSDGTTEEEIVGDASSLYNIYQGGETNTATVTIVSESGTVSADVKVSSKEDNRLTVVDGGLYVDVSDIESRLDTLESRALIAEGQPGEVVVTTDDGIVRSSATIGGSELDPDSETNLAKEQAIIKAMSWQII